MQTIDELQWKTLQHSIEAQVNNLRQPCRELLRDTHKKMAHAIRMIPSSAFHYVTFILIRVRLKMAASFLIVQNITVRTEESNTRHLNFFEKIASPGKELARKVSSNKNLRYQTVLFCHFL